jgi:hypothetical protein
MIIHWSQVLLLGALALFIYYIFRLRSVLADRIIYLACALVGVVLVIFPDLASGVAHLLGIGRGADLLFYLFIIASLFYFVSLNAEIRRLKHQMTVLVRQQALEHPVEGGAKH